MLSTSTSATTTKEAAYRINTANSEARSIKAIFLDNPLDPAFHALTEQAWQNLQFYRLEPSLDDFTLVAADGSVEDPIAFTQTATIIVVFSSRCERTELAAKLGQFLNRQGRTPTLFILDKGDAEQDRINSLLNALRPYASMIVQSSDEGYIDSMLSALRA
ncbi:MAG: hypothetical protein ACI9K8_000944 [Reinekea sp.]|jgi:hypothetical protein